MTQGATILRRTGLAAAAFACSFSSGCIATTAVVDNYIQRPPLIHRVETVEGAWLGSDGQLVVQWTSAVVPANAREKNPPDGETFRLCRWFATAQLDLNAVRYPSPDEIDGRALQIPLSRVNAGKAPAELLKDKKRLLCFYQSRHGIPPYALRKRLEREEFSFRSFSSSANRERALGYLGSVAVLHGTYHSSTHIVLEEHWLEPYSYASKAVGCALMPLALVGDVVVAVGGAVVVVGFAGWFVLTLPFWDPWPSPA